MRRADFEHVLAAAAQIVDASDLVVVGSQAILGTVSDPPAALLLSMEVDVYVPDDPEKSDRIDGALGDGSMFHQTFGFYAHAVGPETAKAPSGWESRLVSVRIPPRSGSDRQAVARCLELHDLVLTKCCAGRERDWKFARQALQAGLVDLPVLLGRVPDLPVEEPHRQLIRRMLVGMG